MVGMVHAATGGSDCGSRSLHGPTWWSYYSYVNPCSRQIFTCIFWHAEEKKLGTEFSSALNPSKSMPKQIN